MPILPGNQSNSPTVLQIAKQLKADPSFYNVLGGSAGWSAEPILTIANEVLSRMLAENMPWIWNRAVVPPFLTVSLQQDYCTQLTDIGWLEDGWIIDINNSTSNSNGAPKPKRDLETVRYVPQASVQSVPFNICFVPNSQAFLGLWQANTAYGCGYGVSMTPRSPIQQFLDVNGNILYIDSTQLGLNIESPGYTGPMILPPGFYPYGTSGSTQPAAPPNATPGTQIQDGSVVWTVANPDGYAMRLFPLPALNGLCWWVNCQYQVAPPIIPTLQTTISPIPNYMVYLFRAGCRAALYQFQGNPEGNQMYSIWEEQLVKALRAADRQQDDYSLYPNRGIMSGYSPYMDPQGIGAAYPYAPGPWF